MYLQYIKASFEAASLAYTELHQVEYRVRGSGELLGSTNSPVPRCDFAENPMIGGSGGCVTSFVWRELYPAVVLK